MVKLSKRLQTIASFVPSGSTVADIGSDHALLPVYLAERGRVSFAVAGEINAGPYEAADKQVKMAGLSNVVQVRLGDGLAVVEPGEVDVVTIAGMGGSLIAHILEEGQQKLGSVRRLILQPNVGEDQVRLWLMAHGWVLEDEVLLEEDGKYYEVLCAVRSANADQDNLDLYRPRLLEGGIMLETPELIRFGPILCTRPDESFYGRWSSELEKLDKIMDGLEKGGTEAARKRWQEMNEERNRIEEVIQCLRKVKQ